MKIALSSLCFSLLLSFTTALLAQEERIPHAQDKPPGPALSPAEAIAKMTMPEGFTVELVASLQTATPPGPHASTPSTQASVSLVLPSSQASPDWRKPSPHLEAWQLLVHASVFDPFPSSHDSPD